MYDIAKAVFQLAADGYAGVVIIALLLLIIYILNKARKRQAETISRIEELVTKSNSISGLNKSLISFNQEVNECFKGLNGIIGEHSEGSSIEIAKHHSEVTTFQHRILDAANYISKDIAELKGMFNAAIAGIHKGIK